MRTSAMFGSIGMAEMFPTARSTRKVTVVPRTIAALFGVTKMGGCAGVGDGPVPGTQGTGVENGPGVPIGTSVGQGDGVSPVDGCAAGTELSPGAGSGGAG